MTNWVSLKKLKSVNMTQLTKNRDKVQNLTQMNQSENQKSWKKKIRSEPKFVKRLNFDSMWVSLEEAKPNEIYILEKKSWKKRFKPNSTSYVWKPQFLERFKFDSIWVSLEEAKLKRLKSDSIWLSPYKLKMSETTQLTKNHEKFHIWLYWRVKGPTWSV